MIRYDHKRVQASRRCCERAKGRSSVKLEQGTTGKRVQKGQRIQRRKRVQRDKGDKTKEAKKYKEDTGYNGYKGDK